MNRNQIQEEINKLEGSEIELLNDKWHDFKELYEFRKVYNAVLFNEWAKTVLLLGHKENPSNREIPIYKPKYDVHKSWKHSDGEYCFGEEKEWFIVSAMLPDGLISNHYKAEDWDFFQIPELEKARYEYDGHTSSDVLERLKNLK